MTCREVGHWLLQNLDDRLDDRQSQRLSAHLGDCRRCGLDANTYRRMKHSLAGHKAAVPADSLARMRELGGRIARGDEPIE